MCSCQSFDGSFSRGAKDNSVYHSVGANDIISSVWSCQSVTFRIWFPLSEKKKKNESFFLFLHLLSIFLQLFRDIQTSLRNLEVSSRGLLSIPHTHTKKCCYGKKWKTFYRGMKARSASVPTWSPWRFCLHALLCDLFKWTPREAEMQSYHLFLGAS